ncbi:MAG TPA: hypothetical protein DD727_00755 [Clostridiales bacterium]|nr:hypothetical protein [Clostridiales bacterium]
MWGVEIMIKFMPTILEHGARLIGVTPSQAACDAKLMADAHIAAYTAYQPDSVTVGIDVYNIEAEALGCQVRFHSDDAIPGILTHPFQNSIHMENIVFSMEQGRAALLLEAAERVKARIGKEVPVSAGICGPFSIAVELCGFDRLLEWIYDEDERVPKLLGKLLEHQKAYCNEIRARGLGITVFESWATPPLISPSIYRDHVMPWEKQLITHIRENRIPAIPLVIGGDTSLIRDHIINTGTTLLLADYKVDLQDYLQAATTHQITLRGNIDPKLIESGPVDKILAKVDQMLMIAGGYEKFILGTGVVSYSTPSENLLAIRNYLRYHYTK